MSWQPPRSYCNLPDPVTTFQVLGERNSGTNFVSSLIADNLAGGIVETRPYGWKHGFIDRRVARTRGLLTIVVYRHPIRWIQSVHAKPLELSRDLHGLAFSDFIRSPWRGAFVRENGEERSLADLEPVTGRVFDNPFRMRSAKITYLEAMKDMPARVSFMRFEDVNRAPRRVLSELAEAFDLKLGRFRPVGGFKGVGHGKYLPRPQPAPDPADITFIRSALDLRQEQDIGYDFEAIPQFDGLSPWDRRSVRGRLRQWRQALSAQVG